MQPIVNLDLFTVGIATAAIGIFGFIVFFNNRKSITARSFLFLSVVTIVWGVINYSTYKLESPVLALWLMRFVMFLALWQAFAFFQFFYVFPKQDFKFSKKYLFILLPAVFIVSILTLTPFLFSEIVSFVPYEPPVAKVGFLMPIFGLFSIGLVAAGIITLLIKTNRSKKQNRKPFFLIFVGSFITFAFIIIFNFIFPSFLNTSDFIPFGSVFLLPFIIFTFYAIIRHHLFNLKVIGTEILTFVVVVFSLFEVILAKSFWEVVLRVTIFVALLFFSILLIRSVLKEVERREQIAKLAKELEKANLKLQEFDRQKTEFLSIASHQLRTPLTVLKGYIELIEDGAYGKVGPKVKHALGDMSLSNERLISLIDEFLDISRIEQGRTKYIFVDHNINDIAIGVGKEQNQRVIEKGLKLELDLDKDLKEISMDDEKVRHVIYNFVDNAIKYSQKGKIKLITKKSKSGVNVKVKDSGLGFEIEDQVNFYQKFYRGKNVEGVNVTGTGVGLYVCKKFIEAHGGNVWAKSDGADKGSEFGFWIPKKAKNVSTEEE